MRALMQRGARAGWVKDGTGNLLVLASTGGRVDAIAFALEEGNCDEQQVDCALEAATGALMPWSSCCLGGAAAIGPSRGRWLLLLKTADSIHCDFL